MTNNLRYNERSKTWMPSLNMRPRERQYAQPRPLLRNQPHFRPIPPMPAYPTRPRQKMAQIPGRVRGPQFYGVPNRPTINQPRIPKMPKHIEKKGRFGQHSITSTLPEPDILPRLNLPNSPKFDREFIKRGQVRAERRMRFSGGGMPDSARFMKRMVRHRRLRPNDLGINATKGSNSNLLNFGSYLGRTPGTPL